MLYEVITVDRTAIGQLARQRRALGDLLALHPAPGAHAALGGTDGHLGDTLAGVGVLVEPEAEGVLDHPGDEGSALPGGEALLGLTGELGIEQLHREYVGDPAPDVFRGQLDAPGQQVASYNFV